MSDNASVGRSEEREPKGFIARYALATFGIYFAILGPTLGGMSIKLQELLGVGHAARALGIVMGTGFMFGPLVQPVVGRLSDNTTSRFGMRRPWLIAGTLSFVMALAAVGWFQNFALIVVCWVLAQICHNMVQGALQATVADSVPEGRLGIVSGIGGASVPAAMLASALALNILPSTAMRFLVPAVTGGALCLLFAFTLKDKVRAQPSDAINLRGILASFYFNPIQYRDFGLAWVTKAMIIFGFSATSTYLTLFLADAFNMSVQAQLKFNVTATICSVGMMVLGSAVGGWASDKLKRRKIFVVGSGCLIGTGVMAVGLAPNLGAISGLTLILMAQGLIGLGFGLFLSVDSALCIDVLPNPDNKAKDLGVLNLANALPGVLAPVIAGTMVIPLGNALAPGRGYAIWFFLAASVAICGGLLVSRIRGVR